MATDGSTTLQWGVHEVRFPHVPHATTSPFELQLHASFCKSRGARQRGLRSAQDATRPKHTGHQPTSHLAIAAAAAAGAGGYAYGGGTAGSRGAGGGGCYRVRGFFDGDGLVVRFSPPTAGSWVYRTESPSLPALDGLRGRFSVLPAPQAERGPVRAAGSHFEHADGTEHVSVGTTSYAWVHHNATTREATLRSLESTGAFNKLRFALFPKWFLYNHEEPQSGLYPFSGQPPSQWDLRAFNLSYWRHVEGMIRELARRGVIADIILFHPYDGVPLETLPGRWGFDCLGGRDAASYEPDNDEHYLRYAVARLASFSNVWWSLANEWDLIACKSRGLRPPPMSPAEKQAAERFPSEEDLLCYSHQYDDLRTGYGNDTAGLRDHWQRHGKKEGRTLCTRMGPAFGPPTALASPVWDRLFRTLRAEDPYSRETSVHNWDGPTSVLYDHSAAWVDHISLQGNDHRVREQLTPRLVDGLYGKKPVVWDEVGYEGNLPHAWGGLTGRQMVDRFWHGLSLGVHVGHGETLLQAGLPDDDQVLWWSKGGVMRGESPARIRWFRHYVVTTAALSLRRMRPWREAGAFGCDCSALVSMGTFMLVHVRSSSPCTLWLPGASTAHRAHYHTYAIDYWNMRRAPLRRCARGPTVVGPAALEAINLSAAQPYVVELHEAREGCV